MVEKTGFCMRRGESGGKWYEPLRLHAGVLRIAAPVALADAPSGEYDGVARLVIGRPGFLNDAGEIDAGHHREIANHAGVAGEGESVLIVEARIGDAHEHVALREPVLGEILDGGGDLAIVLGQNQSAECHECS